MFRIVCNLHGNLITTMDIRRYTCPYCHKTFTGSSIPSLVCCESCAADRHICQVCGRPLSDKTSQPTTMAD